MYLYGKSNSTFLLSWIFRIWYFFIYIYNYSYQLACSPVDPNDKLWLRHLCWNLLLPFVVLEHDFVETESPTSWLHYDDQVNTGLKKQELVSCSLRNSVPSPGISSLFYKLPLVTTFTHKNLISSKNIFNGRRACYNMHNHSAATAQNPWSA